MSTPVRVRRLSDHEGRQLQQIVRRGSGKSDDSVVKWRRALVVLASARLARALETTPIALAGGHVGRPPGTGRAGAHPVLEMLTREQCEEHLLAGGVGRVVFSAERGPVALPVNFAFFDGYVVFRTGATASFIVALGEVAGFEVDRIDDAMSEGWSVVVTGRGERVEDPPELEELESLGIEPWAGGDRETFVRIRAEEISGRSIRQER